MGEEFKHYQVCLIQISISNNGAFYPTGVGHESRAINRCEGC